MRCLTMAAIGSGLLTVTPAWAAAFDPGWDYLDEVVVTASRIGQPLARAIHHTTVLTAEDIRASQAPDLPTLLRQQAGIEVTQTGGMGTQSSLFLRGANSNQTLVLLDGMRIDSATTGATAVDQIMLTDIERIEIVRGNVSALYGSSAIGGVIQIFMRKGAGEPGGAVRAGLGSYGTRTLSAHYGGAFQDTRLHVGVARSVSDGFSAARREYIPASFNPADVDRDGYRNTTLTLNLAHDLRPGHTLSVGGRASRGKVEYDGSWTNRSDQDLDALQLVSDNRLGPAWTSRLLLGASRDALDSFLDSTPRSRVHSHNRQLDWLHTLGLAPGQDLTLSLGALRQRVSSDQPYTRNRREIKHAALGYLAELGRHGLQLNVRHDDYSDFGGQTTWAAGYALALNPRWRVSVNAGSAFRAPTFNDLYNPAWGGNPDLRPEKARSREAGVQYQHAGLSARLVHFDTRTKDLIVYVWPTGNVNLRRARSDGWEASLAGRLYDFNLRASLTVQAPRDAETGQALLRRAERLGSLGLGRRFGAWDLHAEVKGSGERQDIHVTNFNRTRLAGYTLVNLSGRYQIRPDMSLMARIDNLFDRDYSLVHGYNTLGRSAFVQFDWQF